MFPSVSMNTWQAKFCPLTCQGVQQKRPSAAQNAILRRYFLELTQSFIIPLVKGILSVLLSGSVLRWKCLTVCVFVWQERYVASLMPLQKSISPWKSPPPLRPFIQQDFMKTLEKAGPQLTSRLKGDWIGLYRYGVSDAQTGAPFSGHLPPSHPTHCLLYCYHNHLHVSWSCPLQHFF